MAAGRPNHLISEKRLEHSELHSTLSGRLASQEVRDQIKPEEYPSFKSGDLILAEHTGAFIKPCPGTRGYNCCGLQIIHFGLGCYLDCTYCILQSYLNTDALVLFGNLDQLYSQVRLSLEQDSPKRFCTGEFTDSLLLEDMTGIGARLVEIFSRTNRHVLELKTKTVNIRGLLDLNHNERTIISFSMNAPTISRNEELKAPSLKKRLAAASEAAEAGYRLAFHFDPMILHQGWKDGYEKTVHDIFSSVPAERIAWFSMGAFRYLSSLKEIVRRRFPDCRIMEEEFILAPDGKMRYLRPLRVEMYRHLLEKIREADPNACVYMCMENPRVWTEVFGYNPESEGLIELLDKRV